MNAPTKAEKFEPIFTAGLEQMILGTVMMRNDLWPKAGTALTEEDFSEPLHAQIFTALGDLISRGQAANPVTLLAYMPDTEVDRGGLRFSQYLAKLCADAYDPISFSQNVRALQDGMGRRRIDATVQEFMAVGGARDLSRSASEVAGNLLADLRTIMARGADSETRRTAGDAAGALIATTKKIRAGEITHEACTTGLVDVDEATGGLEAGTLWIVGARPGMGKTAWAASCARRVAKSGTGALLFSLEVPENQMMARILSDMTWGPRRVIPFGDIYRGRNLSDEDVFCLEDAQKDLANLPLILDFANRPSLGNVSARVRAEKEQLAKRGIPLRAVFIDYLKFVMASDRYRGQRHYEVGEISAGLKALAREEGLCVVLLAQLNRANEQREDKRPGLADLRESGDLEADADVVCFIHREAYYIEKSPSFRNMSPEEAAHYEAQKNRAELILGKNRSGPVVSLDLFADVSASTFADLGRG